MKCPRCFRETLVKTSATREYETVWVCGSLGCWWRGTIDDASAEEHSRESAARLDAEKGRLGQAIRVLRQYHDWADRCIAGERGHCGPKVGALSEALGVAEELEGEPFDAADD